MIIIGAGDGRISGAALRIGLAGCGHFLLFALRMASLATYPFRRTMQNENEEAG
jgi:hypothetical protein